MWGVDTRISMQCPCQAGGHQTHSGNRTGIRVKAEPQSWPTDLAAGGCETCARSPFTLLSACSGSPVSHERQRNKLSAAPNLAHSYTAQDQKQTGIGVGMWRLPEHGDTEKYCNHRYAIIDE